MNVTRLSGALALAALLVGCAGGGASPPSATDGDQGWPATERPDDDDGGSTAADPDDDDDSPDDDPRDDDDGTTTGDAGSDEPDEPDDGSTGSADETTGPTGPLPGQLRAFVTFNEVDGNFGGLWGGDEFCQTSADSVGLDGTFMAFLPWGDYPAQEAFGDQTGPWVGLDGTVVFLNPAGLSLDPLAPIAIDERGTSWDFKRAWTGSGSSDCDNWGTGASGMSGGTGFAGTSNLSMWKDGGVTSCDTQQSLYCLEYVVP